ncbi:MAG: hypothetical protein E6J31_02340 [Chloroflexi bacterium]|nr:MAG: hypothetical protein E6J31_02340 [Chloroflexota bacterium]
MDYGKKAVTWKRLLPIFLCLLSILLAGCDLGNNPAPTVKKLVKAPADRQVYTVPQVGVTDITTLDPALVLSTDQTSMSAIQMIYTNHSSRNPGMCRRMGSIIRFT